MKRRLAQLRVSSGAFAAKVWCLLGFTIQVANLRKNVVFDGEIEGMIGMGRRWLIQFLLEHFHDHFGVARVKGRPRGLSAWVRIQR